MRGSFLKHAALRHPLALLAAVIFVVGIVMAPNASAAREYFEYRPLEFEEIIPAVGTNFTEGESDTPWAMSAHPRLGSVTVYIASGSFLGSDGRTLSDLDRVESFSLFESGTNEGIYRSILGVANWLPSGTYYWQMEALRELVEYQTPIYSFVIAPKPVAPAPQPSPAPQLPPTPQLPSSTPGPSSVINDGEPSPYTPPPQLRCTHGSVRARIGGKSTCLHSGEYCAWRYRRQYRHYHYACVRRGSKFRLVRVGVWPSASPIVVSAR